MAGSARIGVIIGVAVVVAGAAIAYVELRERKAPTGSTAAAPIEEPGTAGDVPPKATGPGNGTGAPPAVVAPGPGSAAPAAPPPAVPAPAAPEMTEDRVEAKKLLESARTEMTSGRYNEALDLLHRAHELAPDPATLFDLARAEHLTGQCRVARQTARRVIDNASDTALIEKAERLLEEIGRCD
jgi:hypothetical protein